VNLTVKLFGELQELCENSSLQLQLPTPSSVGDLLLAVSERYPQLVKRTFRVAVDCNYVDKSFALQQHCEIALIPPVCGG
jgi:molybdopterin converting factor small subunit